MTYLEAAEAGEWPLKLKSMPILTRRAMSFSEEPEKSVDENDAETINEV